MPAAFRPSSREGRPSARTDRTLTAGRVFTQTTLQAAAGGEADEPRCPQRHPDEEAEGVSSCAGATCAAGACCGERKRTAGISNSEN